MTPDGPSGTSTVHDDEALVEQARLDPAAFAPLYQRYVRPIYAFCYQRLGDRDLAEDATSQVFVNALAAFPRYQADSFRGWLYAIARNVVMDERRRSPAVMLDPTGPVADCKQSPEEDVLRTDSERDVRLLLAQLTPQRREVVELRLAGLSGEEIATVLDRRQGAVRAIQFRAYQRLRELLAREGISS